MSFAILDARFSGGSQMVVIAVITIIFAAYTDRADSIAQVVWLQTARA
jgi:hypothetical protein